MTSVRTKITHGAIWLLAGIIGLWLFVVAVVALVLGVPPVRSAVLSRVFSYLEGSLGMHIEADLSEINLRGIHIRDLVVELPKDGYFIRAADVAIDYHLLRLVTPTPELDSVRVRGARVRLPASLFEPSSEPEDDSPTTIPRFRVSEVVLDDGEVTAPVLGQAYRGVIAHARGQVVSRSNLYAALSEVALSLSSTRGELIALEHAVGHYDDAGNTELVTGGRLLGKPFALDAKLETVFDRVPNGHVKLSADGVDGAALDRLGLGIDPSYLKRPVKLALSATSDAGTLQADLDASAQGTLLKLVTVYADQTLDARLHTSARSLLALSSILPEMAVAGDVTLSGKAVAPFPFTATARHVVIDGSAVPDVDLAGTLPYPEVRLSSVTSPQYAKQLAASGSYNIDTAAAKGEVEVRGFGLARVLPGSRGKLSGSAHFSLVKDKVEGAGAFNLLDAFIDPIKFSQASVDVSAAGTLDALTLTGSVRAAHVLAGPVDLESVLADVRGDGKRFDAVLDVRERRGNAQLQVAYIPGGQESTITATGRAKVGERELKLKGLLKTGTDVLHAELGLASSEKEKLDLRADQRPNLLTASLLTTRIKYGPWLEQFGVHGISGAVEAKVDLSVPRVRGGVMDTKAASALGSVAFDVAVPDLGVLDPSLAGITSDATGTAKIDGTWEKPDLDLDMRARAERDGALKATSDRIELHTDANDLEIWTEINAYDAKGKLAVLVLSSAVGLNDLGYLSEEGAKMPKLEASIDLTQRRLDQQSGLLAYYTRSYALAVPVSLGGKAHVKADDTDLSASLDLDVTLYGSAVDSRCVAGSDTAVVVHASVESGELKALMKSSGKAGGEFQVEASSSFQGELVAPKIGPIAIVAKAKELYLPGLPGFCTLRDGRADLDLRIDDVGGEKLTGKAKIAIDDLRAAVGPAVGMAATAALEPGKVTLQAKLSADRKPVGDLDVNLPLTGDSMPTGVAYDKPVAAHLKLAELPIGALLAVGEALGSPTGTIDADLRLAGTIEQPEPHGSVTLDDISLSIAALAQPLQHIKGAISIDQRKITIKQLSARDRDGKVTVDGWANVDQAMRAFADVRVVADEFPLRRQGRIAGELTIDTRLRIEGTPLKAIQAKLAVNGGRLWLTNETGGDVQSMSEHPDIRYVDEDDDVPITVPAEEQAIGPEFALAELKIVSTKDLWVMHSDFSVQLGLDLAMIGTSDGPTMKGEASIRRGNLMLLGRAFEIDKGAIHFAGDSPPNPELDLKATYSPPSGRKLVVTVSGRASGPTVAFSGAATTAAEALAIVSGVGRANTSAGAEQKAQSDARGFATGLTAGLLSATVRRELGDWVPLISVENDSAGRVSSARAGVDASKIIPKFMRSFTRGAYLEGVVGNQQTKPGGRVGLGVRLELTLPKDFLTSVGYGPGPNWSTDFAWAP